MNNKATKILYLGQTIAQYRKSRGFSQNVLADMANISREHLAKIETGKRCISIGLLIDIAENLDVPVKDFFKF